MRTLYLDCFSGISGDMTIGALIDAGACFEHMQSELKKLNLEEEYELSIKKVNKNGITATKFDCVYGEDLVKDLKIAEGQPPHQENHGNHKHHEHNKQNEHHHENHGHNVHHGHHHHRTYQDIRALIEDSTLAEAVKSKALNVFHIIAEAEGKIHGVSIEKVHFHEVGAIDSIIDIVGTAILLDELDIDQVLSKPVPTGKGMIHIAHGLYPVPAPATTEILKGIPLGESNESGELTTPTGAAFVKALANECAETVKMTISAIGYGAGTKDFKETPNVLRIMIGNQAD